jgi:hypothetical protein
MYGIYANIGGILMVNVTIYSIHGSYGYVYLLLVVNLMQSILQIAKPQSSTLTSVDRFSTNHHETIRLLTLLNCGQILHTSLKQRLLGYILSH